MTHVPSAPRPLPKILRNAAVGGWSVRCDIDPDLKMTVLFLNRGDEHRAHVWWLRHSSGRKLAWFHDGPNDLTETERILDPREQQQEAA